MKAAGIDCSDMNLPPSAPPSSQEKFATPVSQTTTTNSVKFAMDEEKGDSVTGAGAPRGGPGARRK